MDFAYEPEVEAFRSEVTEFMSGYAVPAIP